MPGHPTWHSACSAAAEGWQLKRLGRAHRVYHFSREDPPAIEVEPGEMVLVETTDSLDAQIDLDRPGRIPLGHRASGEVDLNRALPLTGPIGIHRAELGDVVGAEVMGLAAAGNAFVLPNFGELLAAGEAAGEWEAWVVELKRGAIQLTPGLQLPYHLMVGCLGLAPTGEPAESVTPGDYGGNHNCIHLGRGATFYLTVQVPGALVSIGDVHATMGDGEAMGTGVECAGEVLLRFHLHKGAHIPGPVLETPAAWMVFGHGPRPDDAITMARQRAVDLVMQHLAVGRDDALVLLAAAGHTRLNEVVNPNCSARVEISKSLVGALLARHTEEARVEERPVPALQP